MNCPKCFEENQSNAVFCQNCGSRLVNYTKSLSSNIITIGRAPDNVIHINEQNISGKHAKIFLENGQVYIEDMDSTNGTFVNGKMITRTLLNLSDYVSLGNTSLNLNDNKIINLFSSKGISTTANKTSIESGISRPQVQSIQNLQSQPQVNPQNQPYVSQSNQVNINVVTSAAPKNVGVALLLTFFFGSFGMFYSTITGGIVMSCINLLLFLLGFLTLGVAWFGYFFTTPICMVWAAIAASEANKLAPISIQNRQ
jgi:hypothetical protein